MEDSGKVLTDAWDYKGRPAKRSTTGSWKSAAMILVVELNERLTTLGIAVNLVTYLTGTMHLGNAVSANAVTNFLGTSFMLCLLGGFIADTFLGRYLTIAIFTAVQAMGVAILTISTVIPSLHPPPCTSPTGPCVKADDTQLTVLYTALYMTALGTGGLKSSVSGFGSDQFDDSSPSEKSQMVKFFNWFFFFISIGSLLAVTVLVYVQDNLGRRWGYGICAVAILLGLAVFLAGTRFYRFKSLVGSPLTQIAAVVFASWLKRGLELPSDTWLLHDIDETEGGGGDGGGKKKARKQRLPHTKQFRFLDRAAIKVPDPTTQWTLSTQTDVEEVKMVLRMLPIWATTIIFWTIYAQMTTFSVAQATTMNRHVSSSFSIPPASLTAFFVASILLTVPFYDRLLLPLLRRLTHNPHGLSPLQRIGVGLVLSALSMAAAALTEINRLNHHNMSVFWLVPQFFLVGAGEAFTYIGQLDFFLRECPKGMKTMSTGLFLSTLSLGFFVSSVLVEVVRRVTGTGRGGWLADDLNEGRLYDFYWLLAGLSVVNFGVYLVCARWYVYKEARLGGGGGGGGDVELEEEACCHA
ncbi:Nitrate transporter 1.1 [Acorus calamus]|uniref:Nitrate transporter 1.1 n=1 Tax=Acorus calamus TaxID=4465 RepID=A0AAV9FSS8_ACOCL|nr:Nitrate transporter 1.1 [Acorus calamus]